MVVKVSVVEVAPLEVAEVGSAVGADLPLDRWRRGSVGSHREGGGIACGNYLITWLLGDAGGDVGHGYGEGSRSSGNATGGIGEDGFIQVTVLAHVVVKVSVVKSPR